MKHNKFWFKKFGIIRRIRWCFEVIQNTLSQAEVQVCRKQLLFAIYTLISYVYHIGKYFPPLFRLHTPPFHQEMILWSMRFLFDQINQITRTFNMINIGSNMIRLSQSVQLSENLGHWTSSSSTNDQPRSCIFHFLQFEDVGFTDVNKQIVAVIEPAGHNWMDYHVLV